MLPLLFWLSLQTGPPDTLSVRLLERAPAASSRLDSTHLGPPTIRIQTLQGTALVWLIRVRDTVFVAASIPDTTHHWGDDFVLSLDTEGDGAPEPAHDDFQLYFRRVLDSSVVYRGRNGRWEPPRDDPDWRLGPERSGGGWEVSADEQRLGWNLLLRLDPAWFVGKSRRLPRVAIRIYDNAPSMWYAWPRPLGTLPASRVEQSPALWCPVRQ